MIKFRSRHDLKTAGRRALEILLIVVTVKKDGDIDYYFLMPRPSVNRR